MPPFPVSALKSSATTSASPTRRLPKKDGPAARAPAPAADANRPARRTIRLVSGALREQLVQVELYLDLYRMDASEENPDASSDEEDL